MTEFYFERAPMSSDRAWGRHREFVVIEDLLKDRRGMQLIEFGCAREDYAKDSDGWSTVFLADLAVRTKSTFDSIEISSRNIDVARGILTNLGLRHPLFICGDALTVAKQHQWPKVDFAYLDGCALYETDANYPKHIPFDQRAFDMAHLQVFQEIESFLSPDAVVALDDPKVRGDLLLSYMQGAGWHNIAVDKATMTVMVR